jgi:hypothetical protein
LRALEGLVKVVVTTPYPHINVLKNYKKSKKNKNPKKISIACVLSSQTDLQDTLEKGGS